MTTQRDTPLTEALAQLETTLERPVIPGELEAWAGEVRRAGEACAALLREQIQQRHAEQFSQITEDDHALVRRVEQIRTEDETIRKELDDFLTEAGQLVVEAPTAEPDEAVETERIEAVRDKGLGLVIRIRKQELAIQTWLVESEWRDRGVQD